MILGDAIASLLFVHIPQPRNHLARNCLWLPLHLFEPAMMPGGAIATPRKPIIGNCDLAYGLAKDYSSQVALEADFDQLILARRAINRIDVVEQLRHLKTPTLVMVGDQFGQFFIEINRKIANAIQDAQFVVLKEAMDPSNLVNPASFNREVLTFLQAKPKAQR